MCTSLCYSKNNALKVIYNKKIHCFTLLQKRECEPLDLGIGAKLPMTSSSAIISSLLPFLICSLLCCFVFNHAHNF